MPLSPQQAWELQTEVVAKVATQRRTWVPLALLLADFHAAKAWEALGLESFETWLGEPEISLGRTAAYAMVAAWNELVVERGISAQRLATLDLSKVQVILAPVRRGVPVEEALSDCETLSRSDLRALYGNEEEANYYVCEACGSRVKVPA